MVDGLKVATGNAVAVRVAAFNGGMFKLKMQLDGIEVDAVIGINGGK